MTDDHNRRPIIGQLYRAGMLAEITLLPDAPPTLRTPRPLPPPTITAVEAAPLRPSYAVDEWHRIGRADGRITVLEWLRVLDAPLPEHDRTTHEVDVTWVHYDLDEPRRPKLTPADIDKLGKVLPNGLPAYDLDPETHTVVRSGWGRMLDELVAAMAETDDEERR